MYEYKSDDYKSLKRHFLRAAKKYLFRQTKSSRTIVKLTRHIVRVVQPSKTLIIESIRKEKRKEGKKKKQTVEEKKIPEINIKPYV